MKLCPRCGTADCIETNPNVRAEGPGTVKTDSASILKTCRARQQLKVLKDIKRSK